MRRWIETLVLAVTLTMSGAMLDARSTAVAQESDAAYFEGKTIRLIVGYSAGGGYDLYARMIAPYLGKALSANVIVENQPGAAGMTALNRLYVSQPDGLQLMLAGGTAASMAQLLGEKGVRYDLAKVGYLGLVSRSPYVWVVAPGSPIKTASDAARQGKRIVWGATGPMDGLSDGASFTCEALALDCKVLLGFKSTNEVALALARGEADAIYTSDPAAINYVRAGNARAIATMARTRSVFFPDLPTIFEAVELKPDQQWWFDFRSNVDNLGRILIVPPGMAPSRLAFMQEAARKALSDPELIAEGQRSRRLVDFQDPASTATMAVSVVGSLTPEQRERIRTVVAKRD
jgi:tripartite-type tricarboxylate transporter receptor subunit TctC